MGLGSLCMMAGTTFVVLDHDGEWKAIVRLKVVPLSHAAIKSHPHECAVEPKLPRHCVSFQCKHFLQASLSHAHPTFKKKLWKRSSYLILVNSSVSILLQTFLLVYLP
ncbi:hypothetical protein CC86DRAFT_43484 [Ophiobolus disseminans]|uniref:Uncharacterized protein n=1 Tax=Ophiobolus disseminans TaxID=1469910 RepID=A0A6A6ZWM3_9PLEO|nr:hypothetical protein CC86DRAFT_43484 [Ophiobolus disseminans]